MVSGVMTPELHVASASAVEVANGARALTAAATAIRVDDVSMTYTVGRKGKRTVLQNISLEIEEGECVVLLGETGCGKSTLLRMLLGQEPPTSGSITVAGKPVERVDSRSGYVPQRYSLFPDRTVLENLCMGPETSKAHIFGRLMPGFRAFRKTVRAEAMRQLEHMGLHASDAAKYPHQLSGGMQQRVAIAQALMMKSRVLLMDEAFSALDPATRASLQRLLRSVWSETKPTIVFVTHNTAEALFLGTRVIVLRRESREDSCGSRVALDMKLPAAGMSLHRNGKEFLDLVEYIESFSRGDHQKVSSDGDDRDGSAFEAETTTVFPLDGETL
ncbi:ABC transporter ATP-binding protein [Granulicella paludicola]|uniref:ABC transporter ATP-binding protein n=1 Tax=Granulicella paludicola TaxID=474951 RepID=UPI0021DF6851|nr:ATP-binding cassette domain-containing protein [Granulicella paludicola]